MATRQEGRVFGLYRDFPSLRWGVDRLKALRFSNNDISVLFPEAAVSKTLPEADCEAETAPGQADAFIGGSLGWLTYVRPDRRGIIADALIALGVNPSKARVYEEHLRSGCLLLCIRLKSLAQVDDAESALAATGAESVVAGRAVASTVQANVVRRSAVSDEQRMESVFTCG